ncbi:MAG: thermonuclease family protein [Erythrobacter sp.]
MFTARFTLALAAVMLAGFSSVMLFPFGEAPRDAAAQLWQGWQNGGAQQTAAALPVAGPQDQERALFPICGRGRRVTCVIDGDTIWYRGTKIRIADINTPEVSDPECAAEAQLADKATRRMQELLNAGAFTLAPNPDGRSTDRYGRNLNIITRGGESLGQVLVREGLAHEWGGYRRGWC